MNSNEMMNRLKEGQRFVMKDDPKTVLRKAYDGTYEMVRPLAFACCAKTMSCMGQEDRIYFGNQMCGPISFMITVDQWEAKE